MKKTSIFAAASLIALAVVGIFAAKANNKFTSFTGEVFTTGGTEVAAEIFAIPLYTNTTESVVMADLNGIDLYYKVSGTTYPLYK